MSELEMGDVMKDSYELTIIISNYNQEKHLAETIDSALAQKVKFPYKIIIVDDYSCKDKSRDIIRDYASRYENIEPIFGEENRGYLTNILRAKAKTKTKYFCLLDADDYWTDLDFLQRAYDFLENNKDYVIYESNVEVMTENEEDKWAFISSRRKPGTYSKEMFLNNESIPITQTTGMFLRNCIFVDGIPEIMANAVGTRSERSFEGDTGRFIMHLKYGLAYYDKKIVGVYRITPNGIWTSLSSSKKYIINARFYQDYFQFYGSNVRFFVNRAYNSLQTYLKVKQKELTCTELPDKFIEEFEKEMFDDVYSFCKKYEDKIIRKNPGLKYKILQILNIIRE